MNQPPPPPLRTSPLYDARQQTRHHGYPSDENSPGPLDPRLSPRRRDSGLVGDAVAPQRQYSPVKRNYPPGGQATITHHQSPHVLPSRQQPQRPNYPHQQRSPLLTPAMSPPQSPFVYPKGPRQPVVEALRRRSKTPPRRQPIQQKATAALEDENKRKIRYIQKIWPSASHYEILKCLQQNDFHVRKTIEALVDKFTLAAAASEQSKMLMAQSIAYYNDVHRVKEQSPLQNSFIMLQAQAIEKPQGLSGEELEKYGMLQSAVATPSDEENFTPAQFVSHVPDQLIPPSGKKKALLIGINYYGSKKELNGCCDDVMRMKKLITSVYGFLDKPAFLTVLSDKPGGNPSLLPTKRNILGAMAWLVENAERGDVLFFHFSGHGGQKKDLSGTEIDGFDETIMPLDYKKAGHITDDEIHNMMIKRLKNGVKLISVMDCCHSGSGMDLPFYLENNAWKQELFPKFSEGDVQLFSSCQDSETAADLMIPSWGAGGAVTLAIVSALSQNPFGWTFNTLMSQIQLFLSERKFTQKPQLSSTQKFDINRSFSFQEITANTNPMIGTKQPKRRRQQRPARDLKILYNNTRLAPPTPTPVNFQYGYPLPAKYEQRPDDRYSDGGTYDSEDAYPQEVVDLSGRTRDFPGPLPRRGSPANELLRFGANELIRFGQDIKRIVTGV